MFPTKKGRRKIFEELVLRDVSLLDFNELCKRGNLVIQKKKQFKSKNKSLAYVVAPSSASP